MVDALHSILGRRLSSVDFVEDYVQLRFDGVRLTINAPLSVTVAGSVYGRSSPTFAARLRDRIGQSVRGAATITDTRIVIELTDDATIEVSLQEADQVSPEAAVLTDENGHSVVW